MTEIDKPGGWELACATARARGWTVYVLGGIRKWCGPPDEEGHWTSEPMEKYRPDLNIAQAWELDEEGWLWDSIEKEDATHVFVKTKYPMILKASARRADHPTKSAAYATARCRAFLKAKEATMADSTLFEYMRAECAENWRLRDLREVMSEKHTPGPWSACGNGECQCKVVMYEDGPVAKVISGKWGDEFPNIRLVKNEQGIGEHAEAFVEMIEYGELNEETAAVNANLIAAAPDLKAVALTYEQWEADVILDSACWRYETPHITQALWDRFCEIQAMRNAALAKAHGEVE